MTPYVSDPDFVLYLGDVRECLRELPAESVHCVVTSPPYWGLRDYGTGSWEGGDPDCDHLMSNRYSESTTLNAKVTDGASEAKRTPYRDLCGKCGATRTDQQLGLEPTPDVFVARMVDVFREVRRVLRDDGTLWLNLGDSYMAAQGGRQSAAGLMPTETKRTSGRAEKRDDVDTGSWGERDVTEKVLVTRDVGLKPKDLCGIPWRVAFALQADGWWLRSDIIWSKPNPMPESVTDRPTKAHEYVFLLTKSPRYFFDQEAVRERYTDPREGGDGFRWYSERYTNQTAAQSNHTPTGRGPDGRKVTKVEGRDGSEQHRNGERWPHPSGRNVRSVWEIATQPYPDAHFATFPEALPERCIKAGTSERGCCPECGAPWERVVVATGPDGRRAEMRGGKAYDENGKPLMGDNMIDRGVRGAFNSGHAVLSRETTGWRPSCDHDAAPVPCVVLDPFMGSGTTALVARRLGRRSVGVELNPEYAALCARRLQQLSLEFA